MTGCKTRESRLVICNISTSLTVTYLPVSLSLSNLIHLDHLCSDTALKICALDVTSNIVNPYV